MSFLILALLFSLAVGLAIGSMKLRSLRHALREGIEIWSGILPVVAFGTYLIIMLLSFLPLPLKETSDWLIIKNQLNDFELLCLLVAGFLFVTRIGHFIAAAVALYGMERVLISEQVLLTPSLALVISCAVVLAVLGDKMPWHNQNEPVHTAARIREILLLACCFAGLIVVFAAALRMAELAAWLTTNFAASVSQEAVSFVVLIAMIGWLTVAFGFARQYIIPAILLPTIVMLAFLTKWSMLAMMIPLAAGMALSLTSAPPVRQVPTLYQ